MKDDEEALHAAVMGIRIQSCWAGAIPVDLHHPQHPGSLHDHN